MTDYTKSDVGLIVTVLTLFWVAIGTILLILNFDDSTKFYASFTSIITLSFFILVPIFLAVIAFALIRIGDKLEIKDVTDENENTLQ